MRMIDADEIRWADHYDSDGNLSKYKVAYSDEMPPTVDAVPVIRCKDCKYAYSGYKKYVCTRQFNDFSILPDGYCSLAERKEE